MSLPRRALVGRLAALSAGLAALRGSPATAAPVSTPAAPMSTPDVPLVVYHLSDAIKVDFVLGNIDNHFDGMGGPDKVHIALVVHGPALLSFKSERANGELTQHLARLVRLGVDLGACGNTLKAQKLTVGDLLPGFAPVPEGGVVRLAQLQAQGYAYLRP